MENLLVAPAISKLLQFTVSQLIFNVYEIHVVFVISPCSLQRMPFHILSHVLFFAPRFFSPSPLSRGLAWILHSSMHQKTSPDGEITHLVKFGKVFFCQMLSVSQNHFRKYTRAYHFYSTRETPAGWIIHVLLNLLQYSALK